MLNKKLLTSLVVASGLSFGTMGAAFAHPEGDAPPPPPPGDMMPPPPPPHHPGHHGMFGPEAGPLGGMIFKGVQLTKDQKKKIHDILAEARKNEKTTREDMKAIHNQMATALLSAGEVTTESLQPILDKQTALEKVTKENHLKTILALRNVLTPEQLAKAKLRFSKLQSIKKQMKELHEMDAPVPKEAPAQP